MYALVIVLLYWPEPRTGSTYVLCPDLRHKLHKLYLILMPSLLEFPFSGA